LLLSDHRWTTTLTNHSHPAPNGPSDSISINSPTDSFVRSTALTSRFSFRKSEFEEFQYPLLVFVPIEEQGVHVQRVRRGPERGIGVSGSDPPYLVLRDQGVLGPRDEHQPHACPAQVRRPLTQVQHARCHGPEDPLAEGEPETVLERPRQ